MLKALIHQIQNNRIVVSRVFAAVFFGVLLFSESAWETSILSTCYFLVGVMLVGIATVGRLWCAIYISGYKNSVLVTSGPYAMSRNPLYFFSMIGFVGIGFATETLTAPLFFLMIFTAAYPFVVSNEEDFLQDRFGKAYADYRAVTPKLIPSYRLLTEPEVHEIRPRALRRHLLDALWFVWIVGLIEFAEGLRDVHAIPTLLNLP